MLKKIQCISSWSKGYIMHYFTISSSQAWYEYEIVLEIFCGQNHTLKIENNRKSTTISDAINSKFSILSTYLYIYFYLFLYPCNQKKDQWKLLRYCILNKKKVGKERE